MPPAQRQGGPRDKGLGLSACTPAAVAAPCVLDGAARGTRVTPDRAHLNATPQPPPAPLPRGMWRCSTG